MVGRPRGRRPALRRVENAEPGQEERSPRAAVSAERESLTRRVELEVVKAYWRLAEARETVRASETLVASARESERAAEAEYKAGTGSVVALVDAQAALTSAETVHARAILERRVAAARLDHALGRPLLPTAGESAGEVEPGR